MAKPRQKRMPSLKRRTKTMITVLVEGNKTEISILPGMFDKADYPNLRFAKINTFSGGSYSAINYWLQKNRDKVDVVLVVCDLDRASNHDGSGNRAERMNLQKTINYYENTNIKNNFFFTFPCFETWLAAGLNISASNLYRHLGYQNTDDGKTDSKLLEKYVKSGGDFVMAAQYFVNKPLYFVKKDFTMKSIIDESNIDKKQSNLYYLKEYLSQLNDA